MQGIYLNVLLFVHVYVMQIHHCLSRVRENAKGKETRSQTKEVVVNVYD